MKLHKIFKVGGMKIPIVSDTWVLERGAAGRAIVAATADSTLSGAVTLALGYGSSVSRFFTGHIISCVQIDHRQQRLTIAEAPAALAERLPIARRNVTAAELLQEITAKSQIAFVTGGKVERIESEAESYNPMRGSILPQQPVFSPGMEVTIKTEKQGMYQSRITGIDSNTGELFLSSPLPPDVIITPFSPAKLTGKLVISAPPWLSHRAAFVMNPGSGYALIDAFGRIFNVPDYCWMPQPDGAVYIGDYKDAAAGRKVFALPATFFTALSASGADCAVIPTLRPGQRLRIGNSPPVIVEQVTLTGNSMRIQFEKSS